MSESNKNIEILIARFLAGEASDKECSQLEYWLNESEVNRNYFGKIKFALDKAVDSYPVVEVDVDKAWENVRQRMKFKTSAKEKSKKQINIIIPTWLRVAAVLFITIGLTWGIFNYYTRLYTEPEMLVFVTHEAIEKQVLSDNSSVTLNRESKLIYSTEFGEKERRLSLEGEAFFEIESIPEKPLIVEAQETFVMQTGTSFNISAYKTDTIIEVFVKTGGVRFFTKDHKGIMLIEGETGIFNRNTKEFSIAKFSDINTISYTNKVFVFYNTKLDEVFQRLSSVYGVKIDVQNDEIKNMKITVSFENQSISFIMFIIAETLNVDFEETENGFVVY